MHGHLNVKYIIYRNLCSLLSRYLMENRAARSEVIWQEHDTYYSHPINVEVKEFNVVCSNKLSYRRVQHYPLSITLPASGVAAVQTLTYTSHTIT